jgi:hypothetical protein
MRRIALVLSVWLIWAAAAAQRAGAAELPRPVHADPAALAMSTPKPSPTPQAPMPAQPQPAAAPEASATPMLKAAPKTTSVETVYQQQNALFARGLTFTPALNYTYSDNRFFTLNGFLALGAIFLGNINVSRLTDGVSNRLQLALNVPFLARSTMYTSVGANSSSSQASQQTVSSSSVGDISGGLYYQLSAERNGRPNVVLNAQIMAPTGVYPYGIKVKQDPNNNNLTYAADLPTGLGVWDVFGGISVIKSEDPAILFAGLNYYHNFSRHFNDISPTPGAKTPGSVAPGDSTVLNLGTAFALNERLSTSLSYQQSFTGSTRIKSDGPGQTWQTLVGSNTNTGVLNLGTTFALNKSTSWITQVGIGVTHDSPNIQISVRFPHHF